MLGSAISGSGERLPEVDREVPLALENVLFDEVGGEPDLPEAVATSTRETESLLEDRT